MVSAVQVIEFAGSKEIERELNPCASRGTYGCRTKIEHTSARDVCI